MKCELRKFVNQYLPGKKNGMNCFNVRHICLFILFGCVLLNGTFLFEHTFASCPDMVRHWERRLQQDGYQTETTAGIISATKSKSAFVRQIALELLTSRSPQEAVPVLKGAIDDNDLVVRYTASHLLGTLGDKSGFERMQKDFEELIPKEEDPNNPKILRDARALEQRHYKWIWRAATALEVGKVLAELGDFRAYDLAAREGLTETKELGVVRSRAADVLGEIGKKDINELKMQGKDPIEVLCRMAEKEKEPGIFRKVGMTADEIGGKAAVQIYEKAVTNPNQPEIELSIARSILLDTKKRIDPNSRLTAEPNK